MILSIQLSLLLLFLFLLTLAAIILISLSFFTPWPKRQKSYFMNNRFKYQPVNSIESFSSLLSKETTSWRGPQHTKPELYLSVIVPAMNEEKRLPIMLEECLNYLTGRAQSDPKFTFEVIVVDDGSTDMTSEVAYSYSRSSSFIQPVFVIQLSKNIGKGGAIREGVLCARGQFIIFADADGATKFADFEKLERQMRLLCNGEGLGMNEPLDWTHPAMVVGSRAHLEKDSIVRRSFFRTILMMGFHTLVWIFTVRTIRDTQCGFKLLSRAAAAKLFPQLHIERWAFDVELIFLAEQLQYSLAEVAVEWNEIDGSKVTPFFSWIQMGRDILLIWFRYTFGIWRINQVEGY